MFYGSEIMNVNTKQIVFDAIDKKMAEIQKQYDFGQNTYKGCPMHNLQYAINTLKELKSELENQL